MTGATAGLKNNTTSNVNSANGGEGNTASSTLEVRDLTPRIALLKKVGLTNSGPWLSVEDAASPANLYFRFTIENTGDAELTNVGLTDPLLTGLTDPATDLSCVDENGQAANLTPIPVFGFRVCTVNEGQDLVPLQVTQGGTNEATTTATGNGTNVTDSATAAWELASMTLKKSITSGSPYAAVDDVIAYSYVVTNSGNVTVTSLAVTDDKATVTCPVTELAPAATTTCTASYTITLADLNAGSVTNIATASGTGPGNVPVTSPEDTATADATQTPALTVDKTITSGSPYAAVDDVIAYSYVVTNSGNVSLTGPVTVADDKATVSCPAVSTVGNLDGELDPTEAVTCTASYTVTQADLNTGSVTNTAKASADGTESNDDSETATADPNPALTLVKTASPTTYIALGNQIGYSYLVKNIGNVTIRSLTVSDDKITGSNSVICPDTTLAPGGETTCTATYTITEADINEGSVTNTAMAEGKDPTDEAVTSPVSKAVVTRLLNPATPPTVSKSFVPTVIKLNEYSVLKIQLGNTNLNPLTLSLPLIDSLPVGLFVATPAAVNADLGGSVGCGGNITATAGSNSVRYEAGSQIPVGGCTITVHITGGAKGGLYTNLIPSKALVTDAGNSLNPTEAKLYVDPADLSVTKSLSTSGPYKPGQAVRFTIAVRNNGPDPASNVLITDTFSHLAINTVSGGGCAALPCTLSTLEVDEERVITVVAAITQSGTFSNTATVSAESPPDPNPDNNSSTVSGSTSNPRPPNPIPTLPEWAVILMGLLMLGLVWEAQRRGRRY